MIGYEILQDIRNVKNIEERVDLIVKALIDYDSNKIDVTHLATKEEIALVRKDIVDAELRMHNYIDGKLDANNKSIESKFDAINNKFDAINNKFDAINNKFDANNKYVDGKFDAIESKFDTINNKIANVKEELKDLKLELKSDIANLEIKMSRSFNELTWKLLGGATVLVSISKFVDVFWRH